MELMFVSSSGSTALTVGGDGGQIASLPLSASYHKSHTYLPPGGMMLLEDQVSGRGGRQMTGNAQNENDESVIDKSFEPKS